MGNTDWGQVAEGGANLAGSWYGQQQADEAAKDAQTQYTNDAVKMGQLENQWNRENATWAMNQNSAIAGDNWQRQLQSLKYNRPEMQSDFGSTYWKENDEDGTFTQHTELSPDLKGSLDTLRGNYNEGIGNLDMGDFGVNNDVMNAMRGLQEPGLQQAEDAQRARYAAMGIPIQSTMMDRGEQTLGDNRSRADLQAIGAGNTAWQQGQTNLRQNLSSMANLETGWNNNAKSGNPTFSALSVPLQNEIGQSSAPGIAGNVKDAYNAGGLAGQATGQSWQNGASGLGDILNDLIGS